MRKRSFAFILIFLMVSVNLSNTEYILPEYFDNQNTLAETSPNNSSNPVEVDMAFLGPFSELAHFHGTGYRAAADIAIEHMNDKQTNYHFQYSLYDTVGGEWGNCDGNTAREAAQDIIDDNLEMVIGPMCTHVMDYIANVFRGNVAIISPTQYTSNQDIFALPRASNQGASGEFLSNALSEYSSPALVFIDDEYGSDFIDSFESAWEFQDRTHCLKRSYSASAIQEDFLNIASSIRDAGCDSIVLGSHLADGANILSALSLTLDTTIPILASDGVCVDEIFEQGGLFMSNQTLLVNEAPIGCTRLVQNHSTAVSLRGQEFSLDCANNSNCHSNSSDEWTSEEDVESARSIYDAFTVMMESYILSQTENINYTRVENGLSEYGDDMACFDEGMDEYYDVSQEECEEGVGTWVDYFSNENPNHHSNFGDASMTVKEAIQFVGYKWRGSSGQITFFSGCCDVVTHPGSTIEVCVFDVHAVLVDDAYSNEGSSIFCSPLEGENPLPTSNYELYGFNVLIDSDGDGIADFSDICEGHDDSFDLDQDGIADGCDDLIDTDGDGLEDDVDVFPNDANETMDSDMDGVGDNADAFPNDANETMDSDMDGVGDNADAFPNDANETMDSDMDGVGDNADVTPDDDGETVDSGGNQTGVNNDVDEEKSSSVAGFTGILGVMALLGAAFIRRKD